MTGLHLAIGVFPLGDQSDDGVGRVGFEFGAVGACQPHHMTSVFNGGDLSSLVFAQYQGSGSFNATIHSIFSTTATFNGTDGYFQGNTPNGAFAGTVTYTYSPIPEPATASMMALVAAIGFLIRRRFAA